MPAVPNKEQWEDFISDSIASDSPLMASGAVAVDVAPAFADGETVRRMKGINDLESIAGDEVQITDTPGMTLTPSQATGYKMYAPIVHRGNAVSESYKNKRDTGVEIIPIYRPQIAAYCRNQTANALGKVLAGLFDDATGALKTSHRGDYRTEQLVFNHVTEQKGEHSTVREDAGEKLQLLVVNSKVYTDLVNRSAITFIPAGDFGREIFTNGLIPKIGNSMILQDNRLCASLGSNGVGKVMYPSYLLGPGALYLGWQNQMELDEDVVLLANGKSWILQWINSYSVGVPGTSWDSTTENPTNAQLATAAKWTKVQRDFEINVRQILTRTDEDAA